MRKLWTWLSKVAEVWIIFIAYLFLLFILTFGFNMIWTFWKAFFNYKH